MTLFSKRKHQGSVPPEPCARCHARLWLCEAMPLGGAARSGRELDWAARNRQLLTSRAHAVDADLGSLISMEQCHG
jgi:hypothetical protein